MGLLRWAGDAIPIPSQAVLVTAALVTYAVEYRGCDGGDFVSLSDGLGCLITGGDLDRSWWGRSVVAVYETDDF